MTIPAGEQYRVDRAHYHHRPGVRTFPDAPLGGALDLRHRMNLLEEERGGEQQCDIHDDLSIGPGVEHWRNRSSVAHLQKVTRRTLGGFCGFVGLAGVSCAVPASPQAQAPRASDLIDTTLMREITRVLAHDSLGGRGTGSTGTASAARIIERACRDAGLVPVSASYRLPVPLVRSEILPETRMTIRGGPLPATFTFPDEFLVRPSRDGQLADFSGPAVFAGTESALRESATVTDLAGAVAVTFGTVSPDMAARLAAAGAIGLVQLLPDTNQFVQLRRTTEGGLWALRDSTARTAHLYPIPSVVLAGEGTAFLTSAAYRDATGQPRFDRTIDVDVVADTQAVTEHNVACALRGTGTAGDTALVYTAHFDHLGTQSSAPETDSIYNGFSDNAAGVGMLLAIARAMRESARRTRHTVLFVFFAAEEVGLLGSEYFVHAPPWPLSRMKAVINLDAGAPPAKPWSWRIAGGDSSAIGQLAVDVALRNGWSAVTSAATPNSDYYPFWRNGVPSVFIIPGPAKYEGISADSSDALRRRWDRYHQPGDEWDEKFPFEGLERYAEYALQVGLAALRR